MGCILLKFYIKPQRASWAHAVIPRCILLKFYIKPQQDQLSIAMLLVVSYWNSTSNHNCLRRWPYTRAVVSYWNSTSNHNRGDHEIIEYELYLIEILHQTTTAAPLSFAASLLYLIEILHQTTTGLCGYVRKAWLYLIEILHQTTTANPAQDWTFCCILLKFYIKPQQRVRHKIGHSVVSYWNSTSNHNALTKGMAAPALYLIEILHQTTTGQLSRFQSTGCILLKFYIKPQLRPRHPCGAGRCILLKFYIKPQQQAIFITITICCILLKFYIKPQLRLERELARCSCILLKFYIKPQHFRILLFRLHCCILLKFYIKPQRGDAWALFPWVVSYWNSTSNHNFGQIFAGANALYLIEILHQTTTPTWAWTCSLRCILLKFYIKPQPASSRLARSSVVSYWNSTSNHNNTASKHTEIPSCILLKFYIKPQHADTYLAYWDSCILLKFYIKPQRWPELPGKRRRCILLKFYIKPQPSARVRESL